MSAIHPRPAQLTAAWVLAAVAVLGWIGYLALILVDASRNLPDPVVGGTGLLAVAVSLAALVVGLNYVAQANVLARLDRIAAAQRDLKDDTGEIPGLTEAVRRPHYIVVRDPGPYDKLDGDGAMRVRQEAGAVRARRSVGEDRDLYWKTYTDAVQDLAGLGGDDEGASPPQ